MQNENKDFVYKIVNVISDSKVVINAGHNEGISVGSKFIIYKNGDNIIDPDTGEDLGVLEIVKGNGVATHVQEKMSTISGYRKVRKRSRAQAFPFGSVWSSQIFHPQSEEIEDVENSFDAAAIGDLAKRIF